VSRKPALRFPWRSDNRFQLLVDGNEFFPAMLHAIGSARQSILMEMYLIESGTIATRFIDAFSNAVTRGVHTQILIDAFGARAFTEADRARLTDSGVDLAIHNPLHYGRVRRNLFRTHRKLLIVDGRVAFTGGAGICDEFDHECFGPRRWHDAMVKIEGTVVADWNQAFSRNWARWSQTAVRSADTGDIHRGSASGRVALSRGVGRNEITRALLNRTRAAQQKLWVATAYFLPSLRLRRHLCRAARRGVDIRLLLPGAWTDHPAIRHAGRRYYSRLLRAGIRIFEYQPRFQHAKALLIDDWISIGSSNIDRWNFRWNLEANQEIINAESTRQISDMFETDFAQSTEVSLEDWRRRPWRDRLQERWWGFIDRWVDRFVR
jgi:cardiolipin synthase